MVKSALTFRKLEMVEAIAKLGSVSAAAEAMGISQPALTQGIQSIEAELGITLFSRGPRGLQPTSFARPFLNHIDTIRVELTETRLELEQPKADNNSHTLRVTAGIRSCKIWVNQALKQMKQSDPALEVTLDHDLLPLYSRLMADEIDIGVSMTDLVPESSNQIVIEPLGQWRVLFICRADHPLANQKDLTLDQLRAYPLAGHFNYPVILRLFNEGNGEFGRLDISDGWPTLSAPIESLEFLTTMLQTNDCLGIMPRSGVARELEEGSLTALHITGNTEFYVKLVLVYLQSKAFQPEIVNFIKTVKQIETARISED